MPQAVRVWLMRDTRAQPGLSGPLTAGQCRRLTVSVRSQVLKTEESDKSFTRPCGQASSRCTYICSASVTLLAVQHMCFMIK
jgi:hypothetical protein